MDKAQALRFAAVILVRRADWIIAEHLNDEGENIERLDAAGKLYSASAYLRSEAQQRERNREYH